MNPESEVGIERCKFMKKFSEIIFIGLLVIAGIIFVTSIYNGLTGSGRRFAVPTYGDSIGLVEIEG